MKEDLILKTHIFKGACTALITPFKNGKIDFEALSKIIEYQISEGVSALLVSGTTGESATLDYDEHSELIEKALQMANGRVPLLAGTGSNDTKKAVKMTEYACKHGVSAVLSVTPYYNKTNQKGIVEHYREIAKTSDVPVIVYNVPSRTGVTITPETYARLSEIDNIRAIKEAGTNVSEIAYAKSLYGNKLQLFCGNDDLTLPLLALGADGVISVLSNICPAAVSRICSEYFSGNYKTAKEIYMKHLKFSKMLFCDINPIPIKEVMAYKGFCTRELRLPLVGAEDSLLRRLYEEYERLTK